MATANDIQNLYIAYFNRPADVAGLQYWTAAAQANFTPVQIAQLFSQQPEYANAFAGFTTTQTVNTLFNNLFNHNADPAGLAYWVGQVQNGTFTIGQAAIGILAGATGADAAAVAAKQAAANAFTTAMSSNVPAQVGYNPNNGSFATAKAWLATVVDAASGTAAAGTMAAALTSIATNGGVGQTLTSGTDTLTGNLFTAGLVFTPGGNNRLNSLQDEDVLTGTGTNATLNATLGNANNDGGTTITPTLKGINTVNVNFSGSSTVSAGVGNNAVNTLSFQRTTGATNVNVLGVTNNTGTVTLMNIAEATTNNLSLASMLGGNVQNAVFHYQTGVLAKGGFTANLGLNNVNIGTAQLSNAPVVNTVGTEGFSTLNLSSGVAIPNQANAASTAQNSLQTLIVPTMSTLNIAGGANLSILTTTANGVAGSRPINFFPGAIINGGTALTTVNASTFTGNLTIDLSGYTNVQTTNVSSGAPVYLNFTAGTGNDTVYIGTATDTTLSKATIDGGTGTNTLKLFNNFAPSGATTGIVVKNIQNLTVTPQNDTAASPAAVTVDTSAVGSSLVRVDVRNEDNGGINQAITLTNISSTLAAPATAAAAANGPGLYLHHSTTGESGILNNNDTFNLAATGAGASEAINLVTDLNTDARSNYTLTTRGSDGVAVGNLTLNDLGVESHNINVTSLPATSLTIKGGTAGTFMNLDAISHGGVVVGGYQLDASGSTAVGGAIPADTVNVSAFVDSAVGVLPTQYQVLGASVAGDRRFSTTKIDSTGSLADFIVRVGGQGSTNLAQSITLGNATNTVIFDAQNNINAGLSSIVSVTGGTGLDTIALNGNLTAGGVTPSGTITLGVSEWQNVKNIDVIRLIENGVAGVQNVANLYSAGTNQPGQGTGAIQNAATAGGYNLTITNALVGQADAGKTFTIVNNDGLVNVGPESQAVIDASQLATNTPFKFIGANKNFGVLHNSNNIILSDASFSKNAVLAGGNVNANGAVTTTVANNNSLTILNTAQVTFDDLANKSDFATIYVKNNQSVAQTATIQLNGAIIDALVDSSHKAATSAAVPTANVETLTIVALDNIQSLATAPGFNNPNITTSNVVIDASTILGTAGAGAYGLNVVLGRGASVGGVAANQVTGTGTVNDTIVELGNYAPATYNAAINLPSSTSNNGSVAGQAAISVASQANGVTVGQRIVTDTINDPNATLITYGAIDLTGVNSLSGNAALIGTIGVAKLVANSDITITASEFAALTSITFSGAANHTLRITGAIPVGTTAAQLALSKITFASQIAGQTLTVDNTTVTGGVFNGVIGASGPGNAPTLGAVTANFNSAGVVVPVGPIAVVAGALTTGTTGNDTFTATDATLLTAATSINGNGGVDVLNVTSAFTAAAHPTTIVVNGGIVSVPTLNLQQGGNTTGAATFLNQFTTINDNKASGGDTIALGTVAQTLNLNNTSGAETVVLGAAGQTVNQVTSSSGPVTVQTTNANSVNASLNLANANGGANILTFTDAGTATLGAAALNGITTINLFGAETLTLSPSAAVTVVQAAAAATLTGTTAQTITVTGSAGQTLTLAGAANFVDSGNTSGAITTTGSGTLSVTDGAFNHTVTNNGTGVTSIAAGALGANTDTVNGTGAIAVTAVGTSAGNIILDGGTMNGALTVTTASTNTATVTEGAGTGAVAVNLGGTGAVTINTTATHATTVNQVSGVNGAVVLAGAGAVTVTETTSGNLTVTGSAGLETVNLAATGAGVDNVTVTTSTMGTMGTKLITINNFKATGADILHTGNAAVSLNALNIASSDNAGLVANIAASANTFNGGTNGGGAQYAAYYVTVAAGAAAGTYVVEHMGAANSAIAAGDIIVKLTGTTGALVNTDIQA